MEWSMLLLGVATAPRVPHLGSYLWDAKWRSNVFEASRRKPYMFLDDYNRFVPANGGRRSRVVVSLARLRNSNGVGSQRRGKASSSWLEP
jgi:hypothetical protein